MTNLMAVLLCVLVACSISFAADTVKTEETRITEWRKTRFGMFIHWGPVSITGHEIGWSRGAQTPVDVYDNLYKKFSPEKFNADEWVQIAKNAGMKYIVLTTKHHDGFCLWDTKQTDHNIMNSPFKRDVTKELAEACKKQGIAFGVYYSTCDWYHPDFPLTSPGGSKKRDTSNLDRYTEYLKAQVSELITNYGPLYTVWFDVPQEFSKERGQSVIDMCMKLQPNLVINNRTGAPGDYDTPEQHIGGFNINRPWETCMTICNQWAWKPNDPMKSLKQCLQTLILTAGGDGNLLFNVGPTPEGIIESRQADRLKEMGEWLKINGNSIYNTRGGPFKPGAWGASTRSDNTIYIHAFQITDNSITLPAITPKITAAKTIDGTAITFAQSDEGITLTIPADKQNEIDTLIALTIDGDAMSIEPMSMGGVPSKVTASNVFQNDNNYAADKATDGDASTRWATDAGTKQAFIEIEFTKTRTISGITIDEWVDQGKRVQAFTLQYWTGQEWKTFHTGTTIGKNFKHSFDAITTTKIKLDITDASEGPTINEISFTDAKK